MPHPRLLPLTAAEFIEWEAYASIEPWGFDTDNVRFANLSAVVANFSGNTKRRLTAADFLPKKKSATDATTVADKVKAMFGWRK